MRRTTRNAVRRTVTRGVKPHATRGLATRATDAVHKPDPEERETSDPDLAYYIGHGDHNPDGST